MTRRAIRAGLLALSMAGGGPAHAIDAETFARIEADAFFGTPRALSPADDGEALAAALAVRDPYAIWTPTPPANDILRYGVVVAATETRIYAKPVEGGAFARAGIADAMDVLVIGDRALARPSHRRWTCW